MEINIEKDPFLLTVSVLYLFINLLALSSYSVRGLGLFGKDSEDERRKSTKESLFFFFNNQVTVPFLDHIK